MKKIIYVFLGLFVLNSAFAKHYLPEKYYQQEWCTKNNGIMEYKLIDDTRVDCLTKDYAVEFDFATKWAEAVGQSLHYSRMTGKKAGINLIIEKPEDFKYYNRIVPLCKMYDISLWYSEKPSNYEDYSNEISIDYIIKLLIKLIQNILKIFA